MASCGLLGMAPRLFRSARVSKYSVLDVLRSCHTYAQLITRCIIEGVALVADSLRVLGIRIILWMQRTFS